MKKDAIKIVLLILALAFLLVPIISAVNYAVAEEEYFILCRPGAEVNIRERAKLRSPIVGCLGFGDRVISDGKEKNGFIHVIDLLAEVSEGWIYKGLLVEDEPVASQGKAQVFNAGRVACRKYADGKRIGWLKDGSEVEVYAISEEWCVTDHGYIKTEFLTVNAKVRQPESPD